MCVCLSVHARVSCACDIFVCVYEEVLICVWEVFIYVQ